MDFKYSFAWLTGIKKLIFCSDEFFGSGYFLIHEIIKSDQKVTGANNVKMIKSLFFYARQPCEGIFEFRSCCGLIFMAVFGNFDQLVLTHQTFWLKSLLMVSTISGWMGSKIRQKWPDSNIYVTQTRPTHTVWIVIDGPRLLVPRLGIFKKSH